MEPTSARQHWVGDSDDTEISGPYTNETDARTERRDRQPEHDLTLRVINSDDAY